MSTFTGRDSSLQQTLQALYARGRHGMRLGLDRMERALDELGHPERAIPFFHIAGTNGKGSVSAMLESILRASGKRTGLFTSPHLCEFAERIRIDGQPLEAKVLEGILGLALGTTEALTFFETATLAALIAFQQERVDVAVLEVGLGGRLDSTNVIPVPVGAAITTIDFDHVQQLGNTIEAIATEKAGIIKPGGWVVMGRAPREAREVIVRIARDRNAELVDMLQEEEARKFVASRPLPLKGVHQEDNATVAYLLARRLGVSNEACAKGLETVRWPARLEALTYRDRHVLLDTAHNVASIRALVEHVRELALDPSNTALLFGALSDKDWPAMLDLVSPLAAKRAYVRPKGRDAVDPEALAHRAPGSTFDGVAPALDALAEGLAKGGTIVICGSTYLSGEARAYLLDLPLDPPIAL